MNKNKIVPQAYKITVEFSDCTTQQFYHHSVDITFRALVNMFKEKMEESEVQKELEYFVDSEKMKIDTARLEKKLEKRIQERIARDVIGYKGPMKNFNKFLESDSWAKQQYLLATGKATL